MGMNLSKNTHVKTFIIEECERKSLEILKEDEIKSIISYIGL